MTVSTKKWLVVAVVVALCSLHATLFYLRWHHNTGASVQLLVGSFWLALMAVFVSVKWTKDSKIHLIAGLALSAAIILPSAKTSITWTIWTIIGLVS